MTDTHSLALTETHSLTMTDTHSLTDLHRLKLAHSLTLTETHSLTHSSTDVSVDNALGSAGHQRATGTPWSEGEHGPHTNATPHDIMSLVHLTPCFM